MQHEEMVVDPMMQNGGEKETKALLGELARQLIKVKAKVETNYNLMTGDMLKIANLLASDNLVAFSKQFGTIIFNMNEQVLPNLTLHNILEKVVESEKPQRPAQPLPKAHSQSSGSIPVIRGNEKNRGCNNCGN